MTLVEPIWWEYVIFYPREDEPDYDGVHDGGIKGLSVDAPEDVRKAFEQYLKEEAECKLRGIKM